MKCTSWQNKKSGLYVLVSVLAISASPVYAAFFQISENSGAGLGNAFAGGAAIADDASTIWYNPAGLTRLPGSQFNVVSHLIIPSLEYRDGATPSTTGLGTALTGGDGGNAGETAFVPNFYYSRQINERWFVGVGVNAPFGLATDYDAGWVGRYHADRSELKTVNLNPAFGYELSEKLSIGAGINFQYIDAELSQAVDFGTICVVSEAGRGLPQGTCVALGQSPQGNDGTATVTADDTSMGYNVGVLWQPTQKTRVGLAYRSAIAHSLAGELDVATPDRLTETFASLIGQVNGGAGARITLPTTISLSAYRQFNSRWAFMADITQTRWNRLPELRIEFDTGAPDSVVTLALEDSYRYSIGASYTPNDRWSFRTGIAFDETPTPNAAVRTPRLPDEDRGWVTFAASYQGGSRVNLDFSLAYVAVKDAWINKRTGLPGGEDFFRGNLVGESQADTMILSMQFAWLLQDRSK